jgi:hypothetical protein
MEPRVLPEPQVWPAPWLPLEVSVAACGPAAPRSGEPAERYERAERPRVAAAHAEAARQAAPDAQGGLRREAVAASDVEVPRQGAGAVQDAAVPRQVAAAVRDAEALRRAEPDARAARPSAAPWVCRRGPILPWFPAP